VPTADGEAAVGTGRGVLTAGRLACGVACPVAGTGRVAGGAGAGPPPATPTTTPAVMTPATATVATAPLRIRSAVSTPAPVPGGCRRIHQTGCCCSRMPGTGRERALWPGRPGGAGQARRHTGHPVVPCLLVPVPGHRHHERPLGRQGHDETSRAQFLDGASYRAEGDLVLRGKVTLPGQPGTRRQLPGRDPGGDVIGHQDVDIGRAARPGSNSGTPTIAINIERL